MRTADKIELLQDTGETMDADEQYWSDRMKAMLRHPSWQGSNPDTERRMK